MNNNYKLTQYSHGAGCGCKISPKVLDKILENNGPVASFPGLIVGNDNRDDAAVMDINDGTAVISTTDFFMPIVDDPHDFGRIASVNAISDVYAMGGKPVLAIAILGWPVNVLPPEVANEVVNGARKACEEAGIPLAGGHSIDSPEPIFGLAVTGKVELEHLKQNNGAKSGDLLFLTKPLGVGILSTAQKKGKLKPEHSLLARNSMVKLNFIGETFGRMPYINAMTDVTGFGLLGHLTEMCLASEVSAEVNYDAVPWIEKEALEYYIEENCIPGGTNRNWASYGDKISELSPLQKAILCDPQTSGGLLVAVNPEFESDFKYKALSEGLELRSIGLLIEKAEILVTVL
ncbi:MAG: selenide, water dikinase SelD [Bacteroidota bacterium]